MSNLADKRKYLLNLVSSIGKMEHTPFPFLCAATMVEYLMKISGYDNNYAKFICDRFPANYANFQYAGGATDLPDQMYHTLRNGLVHTFSLFPDKKGQKNGGRERSILITHRSANEGSHLSNLQQIAGMQVDAALFVLEDFCVDIEGVIQSIFCNAAIDTKLERKINKHWARSPPATWIGDIKHP